MTFLEALEKRYQEGAIPEKYYAILQAFFNSYRVALEPHNTATPQAVTDLVDLVVQQCHEPYDFEPYHQRITTPFDYHAFGQDFIRPLIDITSSRVLHRSVFDTIQAQLAAGDNVILLSNHQTEAEPQVIEVLLEDSHQALASDIIFVAGDRVLTDAIAAPFSMGRNLLCIYSKRHIDRPPELKVQKQRHNNRAMRVLRQLLDDGGKCIYVAPSGGRDRPDAEGSIFPAPFDPQSLEIFRLMGEKSAKATHFYPLAMSSYSMLPPPDTIKNPLGEERIVAYTPVSMACGEELDFTSCFNKDKQLQRQACAEYAWKEVCKYYGELL